MFERKPMFIIQSYHIDRHKAAAGENDFLWHIADSHRLLDLCVN
jgi:hypothetical protein